MENKNKKGNFIVFQFKIFNALDEQKAFSRNRFDVRLKDGYFEELILDPDVKSKDLLHNDHILLFIDPKPRAVYGGLCSSDDPLDYLPPMRILRCPSCGSSEIAIRKEEDPLCLRCGYSGEDFRTNYPM